MLLKRRTLLVSLLLLALAWAGPAFAQKTYFLGQGSGAQLQIGNGLPLPIQVTDANLDMTPDWGATMTGPLGGGPGGSVFPPLLIPPKAAGLTVMDTAGTSNAALTIGASLLSRPTAFNKIGVNAQNIALYAVATNLRFRWPAAPAMLGPRTATMTAGGGTSTFFTANSMTVFAFTIATRKAVYKNTGNPSPFGGVGQFLVTGTSGAGAYAGLPVTVYGLGGGAPGAPPCTHTMLAGPNAACKANIIGAAPAGAQAPGGALGFTLATVPPVTAPNLGAPVKAGATPLGTIISSLPGTMTAPLINAAASTGFPWTTGMITVSASGATGTAEVFLLTGSNGRNATGAGTIQLVSGSISTRALSGPNANRGWVRLNLSNAFNTPSIQGVGLAVLAGCLLTTAVVTTVRRRRSEMGA